MKGGSSVECFRPFEDLFPFYGGAQGQGFLFIAPQTLPLPEMTTSMNASGITQTITHIPLSAGHDLLIDKTCP